MRELAVAVLILVIVFTAGFWCLHTDQFKKRIGENKNFCASEFDRCLKDGNNRFLCEKLQKQWGSPCREVL